MSREARQLPCICLNNLAVQRPGITYPITNLGLEPSFHILFYDPAAHGKIIALMIIMISRSL